MNCLSASIPRLLRLVVVVGTFVVASSIVMAPAHAADASTSTTAAVTSTTPRTLTAPAAPSVPPTTSTASGRSSTEGPAPSVGLVVKEIAVGTTVSLRLSGFTATVLTIQTCGNEGRRGSVDCNIPDAKTVEVPSDSEIFLADFIVTKPPAPCPCILQVASDRFDEVAVAAFTLLGHPIAPVVDSGKGAVPLQVAIIAEPADDGLWARARTSLAGATWYDVTVIVQNTSASVLQGSVLAVEVGRNTEDLIGEVVFPKVADIAPRGTWRETVRLRLSSPIYGTYVWRATTTAFGLSTTATTTTKNQPTLFVVLAGIFGLALLTLVVRLMSRLVHRMSRRRKPPAVVFPPLT